MFQVVVTVNNQIIPSRTYESREAAQAVARQMKRAWKSMGYDQMVDQKTENYYYEEGEAYFVTTCGDEVSILVSGAVHARP